MAPEMAAKTEQRFFAGYTKNTNKVQILSIPRKESVTYCCEWVELLSGFGRGLAWSCDA